MRESILFSEMCYASPFYQQNYSLKMFRYETFNAFFSTFSFVFPGERLSDRTDSAVLKRMTFFSVLFQ